MSGYGLREQPMLGVHDDIWVRCLALEQNGRKAAICSIELLGLTSGQVERIRSDVASAGYRPEDLILSCTHTHGGPAMQHLRLCGTPSPDYQNFAVQTITECILEAGSALQECSLSIGTSLCHLGVNRRKPTERGLLHELNTDGHTEPELVAAQLKSPSGAAIATVFNYGCHAVCMGAENRLITGDWPGAAARELERSYGAVALFLQGCSGDVNPCVRGTYQTVDEVAAMAIQAVNEALAASHKVDGELRSSRSQMTLSLAPAPDDAELQAVLKRIHARPQAEWQWPDRYEAAWSTAVLEHPEASRRADTPFETGELRLEGAHGFSIAWLPAEAFSTYASHIKNSRKPLPAMVTAYTNGNIGYLPDAAAFPEGGYEVDEAYKYYGYQMLRPEAEEAVLGSFGIR